MVGVFVVFAGFTGAGFDAFAAAFSAAFRSARASASRFMRASTAASSRCARKRQSTKKPLPRFAPCRASNARTASLHRVSAPA